MLAPMMLSARPSWRSVAPCKQQIAATGAAGKVSCCLTFDLVIEAECSVWCRLSHGLQQKPCRVFRAMHRALDSGPCCWAANAGTGAGLQTLTSWVGCQLQQAVLGLTGDCSWGSRVPSSTG
jgi:hypothetical protein